MNKKIILSRRWNTIPSKVSVSPLSPTAGDFYFSEGL